MSEFPTWRKTLIQKLQNRNKIETGTFNDLIVLQNKLYDSEFTLRKENLQLTIENERLRINNSDKNEISPTNNSVLKTLEQKLFLQQEELTDLHKRKSENVQKLIDLSDRLSVQDKELDIKDITINEKKTKINALTLDLELTAKNMAKLKDINTHLSDEITALHLEYSSLEKKLISTQIENKDLTERLIRCKTLDIDKMNEEHDTYIKLRNDKILQELHDAALEDHPQTNGNSKDNTKNL